MASLTSAADESPDVYEDRFNTIVYNGVVALGIGLGQRVGLFKALTDLSGPQTSQKLQTILDYMKDKIRTVLDIGCGVGKLTASIANYFPDAKVVGIDVDSYAIETAIKLKEDNHLTNVEFYLHGADNLTEEWTKSFDWIIMFRVFHDLPNPDPCLRESIRVMKDDGVMTFLDNLGHSNPKLNGGNKPLAATLMVSCYMCLPCSLSAPPAVGNGIGWGLENRAVYIRENGLIIHDNELVECIHCSKATL
ncbi:unnamed protein product [Mytilus edulis]|uniref:Methyltransferase domain-containing protein n=1 Tax=Mytilus edulis TaxID=6550 RepID=A0A8S3PSY2_MYTED|nr:unnamed protein product [Mytilus edulis]